MAILKEGVHGPFSGKIGSIVGYQLNGQNIIRTVPVVIKRKPSPLTQINRARMKAVSQFLRPLKQIIDFGYKNVAPKGSRVGPFQTAQSHTFKHAIDYDDHTVPYVNPEKVLVFRGNHTPPPRLEVEREENLLHLTWDAESCITVKALLIAVAYIPEEKVVWFEEGGAKASQGAYTWNLGAGITPERYPNIHVYAGFYDVIWDELSDSAYAGCV